MEKEGVAAAVASDLVVVAPVVLRDKKLRRNWRRNDLYSHRTMHPRLPSSHHTRSSQNHIDCSICQSRVVGVAVRT